MKACRDWASWRNWSVEIVPATRNPCHLYKLVVSLFISIHMTYNKNKKILCKIDVVIYIRLHLCHKDTAGIYISILSTLPVVILSYFWRGYDILHLLVENHKCPELRHMKSVLSWADSAAITWGMFHDKLNTTFSQVKLMLRWVRLLQQLKNICLKFQAH